MNSVIFFMKRYFPLLVRLLKILRNSLFPGSSVSYKYEPLLGSAANLEGQRLRSAWQDEALPQRQRELVEQQLSQYRQGVHIDVFEVFIDSLRALPDLNPGMSILEVGCSSGFYSEVLAISGLPLKYSGCDYSDAFIRLAREKYPSISFAVEDATALNYPDQKFDIVVSGCCLLHIPEYPKAIAETARVARNYAVFHRTPVVWGMPDQWYRKQAYGIETVEIHFNESEFLSMLELNGLELMRTITLHEEKKIMDDNQGYALRTYVCRKKCS